MRNLALVFVATSVLASGLAASAVLASPGEASSPRVTVRYGDLNPADPGDARILRARVADAARDLCRQELGAAAQPRDQHNCFIMTRSEVRAALPRHARKAAVRSTAVMAE